jgi:general secretion pathway protein I
MGTLRGKGRERNRGPRAAARGSAGFSLLEVLVATALMGLVLVVLLQVLTTALRAQEASLKQSQAVLVAEKVLQEYSGDPTLTAATYQGREGPYAFQVRLTPQYDFSHPQVPGKVISALIQVTVSWQEQGRVKSLELQTIRSVYQRKS